MAAGRLQVSRHTSFNKMQVPYPICAEGCEGEDYTHIDSEIQQDRVALMSKPIALF